MNELTDKQRVGILTADIERLSKQKSDLEKCIKELGEKYNDSYRKVQLANQDAESTRQEANEVLKQIGLQRIQIQAEKKEVTDLILKSSLAKDELDKGRESLRKDRLILNRDSEGLVRKQEEFKSTEKNIADKNALVQEIADDIGLKEHKLKEKEAKLRQLETDLQIVESKLNEEKSGLIALMENLTKETNSLRSKK